MTVFCTLSLLYQSVGVRTKAGAWAETEAEAKLIEHLADGDEKWEKTVAGRQEWINRPIQPPGLGRSGEPRGKRTEQSVFVPLAGGAVPSVHLGLDSKG